MLRKIGSATIEYIAMITFILAAFFIFQHYIARGFSGRWKAVGDTFGHGKQYDPRDFGATGEGGGSYECFFDYLHCDPAQLPPICTTNPESPQCDPTDCENHSARIFEWVSKQCYEDNCDCQAPTKTQYIPNCLQCIETCVTVGAPFCSG